MNRKLLLILFCFVCLLFKGTGLFAQTPTFLWAKQSSSSIANTSEVGRAIASDGLGNSYVTGSYQGTATFGNISITSNGGQDIFIVKYDASGAVVWARSAGGTSQDIGRGVAVDGSGNSYVTGYFQGSVTFGGTTLTAVGSLNMFIVKYDASGAVVWAHSAGGSSYVAGSRVAVDGTGNTYVTGAFGGTATFTGTTLTSNGADDMFIAKYNASGAFQWVRSAGGTGNDFGNGVAADVSGNSYVTGPFQGTVTFGTTTLTSNGEAQYVFIVKYDASGALQWARSAGSAGLDSGNSIAVDGTGNSYVTGSVQGTATFGTITLTNNGNNNDMFIAKYDASGSVLWARSAGGTSDNAGNGVAVDGLGNSYVTGPFQGTSTFGTTTLTSNGNNNDIFIVKYDPAGTALWARSAGGTGNDIGRGVALDATGNSYVAGTFQGPANFGTTTLTSTGLELFVTKLSGSGVTAIERSDLALNYSVYPNPTKGEVYITGPIVLGKIVEVKLLDAKGKMIAKKNGTYGLDGFNLKLDLTAIPAGVYVMQVVTNEGIIIKRVVKQ